EEKFFQKIARVVAQSKRLRACDTALVIVNEVLQSEKAMQKMDYIAALAIQSVGRFNIGGRRENRYF
ncbi:MAG: hypothetical protein HY22_08500, partial [[Candidatus Thermochlorobacteriaceae] bacterium GBChlB]